MWFPNIYPIKLCKIANCLLYCTKVSFLLATCLAFNLYKSLIYKLVTYNFRILAQVLLYNILGEFLSLVASPIYS